MDRTHRLKRSGRLPKLFIIVISILPTLIFPFSGYSQDVISTNLVKWAETGAMTEEMLDHILENLDISTVEDVNRFQRSVFASAQKLAKGDGSAAEALARELFEKLDRRRFFKVDVVLRDFLEEVRRLNPKLLEGVEAVARTGSSGLRHMQLQGQTRTVIGYRFLFSDDDISFIGGKNAITLSDFFNQRLGNLRKLKVNASDLLSLRNIRGIDLTALNLLDPEKYLGASGLGSIQLEMLDKGAVVAEISGGGYKFGATSLREFAETKKNTMAAELFEENAIRESVGRYGLFTTIASNERQIAGHGWENLSASEKAKYVLRERLALKEMLVKLDMKAQEEWLNRIGCTMADINGQIERLREFKAAGDLSDEIISVLREWRIQNVKVAFLEIPSKINPILRRALLSGTSIAANPEIRSAMEELTTGFALMNKIFPAEEEEMLKVLRQVAGGNDELYKMLYTAFKRSEDLMEVITAWGGTREEFLEMLMKSEETLRKKLLQYRTARTDLSAAERESVSYWAWVHENVPGVKFFTALLKRPGVKKFLAATLVATGGGYIIKKMYESYSQGTLGDDISAAASSLIEFLPGGMSVKEFAINGISADLAFVFVKDALLLYYWPLVLAGDLIAFSSEWGMDVVKQWRYEEMVDALYAGATFEKIGTGKGWRMTSVTYNCPGQGSITLTRQDLATLPNRCPQISVLLYQQVRNHPAITQFEELLENKAVSGGAIKSAGWPYTYANPSDYGKKLHIMYQKKVEEITQQYFTELIARLEARHGWVAGTGYAEIIRIERELGCVKPLVTYTVGMLGGDDILGDAQRFEKIINAYERLKKSNEAVIRTAQEWESTILKTVTRQIPAHPPSKQSDTASSSSSETTYVWVEDYLPACSTTEIDNKSGFAGQESESFSKAVSAAKYDVERIIGGEYCTKGGDAGNEELKRCVLDTYGPAVRAKLCMAYLENRKRASDSCRKDYTSAINELKGKETTVKIKSITGNEPYCVGMQARLDVQFDRECRECLVTKWQVREFLTESFSKVENSFGALWKPAHSGPVTIEVQFKEKAESKDEYLGEKKVGVLPAEKCQVGGITLKATPPEIAEDEVSVISVETKDKDRFARYRWIVDGVQSGSASEQKTYQLPGAGKKGKQVKIQLLAETRDGQTAKAEVTVGVTKEVSPKLNVEIHPAGKVITIGPKDSLPLTAVVTKKADSNEQYKYQWHEDGVLVIKEKVDSRPGSELEYKTHTFSAVGKAKPDEETTVKVTVSVFDQVTPTLTREGTADKTVTILPSEALAITFGPIPEEVPDNKDLEICLTSPVAGPADPQNKYTYQWFEKDQKEWRPNTITKCSKVSAASKAGSTMQLKVVVRVTGGGSAEALTPEVRIVNAQPEIAITVSADKKIVSEDETIMIQVSIKPLPDSGILTVNGVKLAKGTTSYSQPVSDWGPGDKWASMPFIVQDEKGRKAETSLQIYVEKKKPVSAVKIVRQTKGELPKGRPVDFSLDVTAEETTKKTLAYEWSVEGRSGLISTGPTAQFIPEKGGQFSIKVDLYLTTGKAGEARTRVAGDIHTIDVKDSVLPSVKIVRKTQETLLAKKSADFALDVRADEAMKKSLKYEWKVDAKPVAGHLAMQFIPEREGTYSVKVDAYSVAGDKEFRVAGDEISVKVSAADSIGTGKEPTGEELKKLAEEKYQWLKGSAAYLEALKEFDRKSYNAFEKSVTSSIVREFVSKSPPQNDTGFKLPDGPDKELCGETFGDIKGRLTAYDSECWSALNAGCKTIGTREVTRTIDGKEMKIAESVTNCESPCGKAATCSNVLKTYTGQLGYANSLQDYVNERQIKCLADAGGAHGQHQRELDARIKNLPESLPYKRFQEFAGLSDWKGYLAAVEKVKQEFALPDPIPSPLVLPWRYSSSCGGDFGGVDTSKLTVTLKAQPQMKVYKPGEIITIKADVQGGSAPYTYTWTGDHAGKGESVTFSSRKGGSHKLSVEVKDDKTGNRGAADITIYIGAVAGTIENLPDKITYGTWVYPSVKLQEGAGKPEEFKIIWQTDKSLTFFDASTGHPRKNLLETSARIDSMGPIKVWAEILKETGSKIYETVGETDQRTVTIVPPKFTMVFDPPKGKVGKEVKVTLETQPDKVSDLINYEWHTPASSERKEYEKNARVVGFVPKSPQTVKLLVSPKTTRAREFIGGAIGADYSAEPYTVTVGKPRHVQSKPKIWKCDTQLGGAQKCGLYEVEDQFAVFHNISMRAEVAPQPEETPRFRWTISPPEGCRIHNETSQDLTIDCSKTGSYTASVTVRDKNDIVLGASSGSVGVSISQEMLNDSKKKAEEADKKGKDVQDHISKARKFWKEKKYDEAISSAEDAHRLDPQAAQGVMRDFSRECTKLGWDSVYSRKFSEATKFLEYATRLDPQNKDAKDKLEKAKKFAGIWPQVEQKAREFDALISEKKVWSAHKKMLEIQDLQYEMPGGMANPFSKKITDDLNKALQEYNQFSQEATRRHTEHFKSKDWDAMLSNAQDMMKRELSPADDKEAKSRLAFAQQKISEQKQIMDFYERTKAEFERGAITDPNRAAKDLKDKTYAFTDKDPRKKQLLDLAAAIEKRQQIVNAKAYAMSFFRSGEQFIKGYNYAEAAKQFAEGLRAIRENGDTKDPDYTKYTKIYEEALSKDKRIRELLPGVQSAAMDEKPFPLETIQKALRDVDEILSLQPNNSDAQIYKTRLGMKLKNIQDNKLTADQLWEQGKGLFDQNKPSEALDRFKQSLKYWSNPERQKYVSDLESSLAQKKAQAQRLRQEGEVLQNQRKLQDAVIKYKQSVKLWPDPVLEEHIKKIEVQIAKENENKATADRLWKDGTDFFNQNRPSEALVKFKESLRYWSNDERVRYVQELEGRRMRAQRLREEGASYQNQGKLREAIGKYRESLRYWPDPALVDHIAKVEAEIKRKETQAAIQPPTVGSGGVDGTRESSFNTPPSGSVRIAEASWLGMDDDKVGPESTDRPNGVKDGHFRVVMDLSDNTEVSHISIHYSDANGAKREHYWFSQSYASWILGVFRNGVMLNPARRSPLGRFSGRTVFDLYANNSGVFLRGNYFLIEVEGGGVISKKLVQISDSTTTPPTPPTPPDKPVDLSGEWNGSNNFIYVISQTQSSFKWTVKKPIRETASGTIKGKETEAGWSGDNGSGRARGTVTKVDSSDRALEIRWSNGVVFTRPSAETTVKKTENNISVTLKNVSRENVHLFQKGESFSPNNRVTPGESRKVTVTAPTNGWLEFCAGRNGQVISCEKKGIDPADTSRVYTVIFDESNPYKKVVIQTGLR